MRNVLFFTIFFIVITNTYANLYHSGSITSNEIWYFSDSPHYIDADLTIENSITITIEAGCEIKFYDDVQLTVNGRIIAIGSSGSPITFTSQNSVKEAGDWESIYFYAPDSACQLIHCRFLYGGSTEAILSFYHAEQNVNIQNCEIAYSPTSAIFTNHNASYPILSDVSIHHIDDYPIIAYSEHLIHMTNLSFSDLTTNYIYVHGGDISSGTVHDFSIPYKIDSAIFIENNNSVTFDEGVDFVFSSNSGFNVYGDFHANGTSENHVKFRSVSETPGAWYGLKFQSIDAPSNLQYTDIFYAGSNDSAIIISSNSHSVTLDNCSIDQSGGKGVYLLYDNQFSMTGCNVSNCDDYPLEGDADQIINSIQPNTFTDNIPNAIRLLGSEISTNSFANITDLEYHINGDLSVADGSVLTIDPGVNLQFETQSLLTINGDLIADGTITQPITFSSVLDNPTGSHWLSVYFNECDGNSIVDYCNFEHGGQGAYLTPSYDQAMLSIRNSSVEITNSNFTTSSNNGIRANWGTDLSMQNCVVENCNQYGFYVTHSDAHASFESCTFDDCGNYPLMLNFYDAIHLDGLTLTNNTNNRILFNGSNVSTGIIKNFGQPYEVLGNVVVSDGSVLTFEPGVTYLSDSQLYVEGSIIAEGLEAEPIIFNAISNSPGGWYGVNLTNADDGNILHYCKISNGGKDRYGGYFDEQACLYFSNCGSTDISNCEIGYSNHYGIKLSGTCSPNFSNTKIHNCQLSGVSFENSYPNATFNTVTFENNSDYLMKCYAKHLLNCDSIQSVSNTNPSFYCYGGDMNSGTLQNFGINYLFYGSPKVSAGATVVIEPGLDMAFDNCSFLVYGKLHAVGTVDQPIDFHGCNRNAGDWYGVIFDDSVSDNLLQHCLIRDGGRNTYGGDYWDEQSNVIISNSSNVQIDQCSITNSSYWGVRIHSNSSPGISNTTVSNVGTIGLESSSTSSNPTITNCTFSSCGENPLKVSFQTVDDLSNLIFENNGINEIHVENGFSYSTDWIDLGLPYYLNNSCTIGDGRIWNLGEGITLRLNEGFTFEIQGQMNLNGTAENPILITSHSDTPSATDWRTIYFRYADGTSSWNYATIEYGGKNIYGNYFDELSQFAFWSSDVELNHCTIRNGYDGIKCGGTSNVSITNCEIYDNSRYGVVIQSGNLNFGENLSEWNDIFNNGVYNLYLEDDENLISPYVYWGTESVFEISNTIYDNEDESNLGIVDFVPFSNADHTEALSSSILPASTITISVEDAIVSLQWDSITNAKYNVYSADNPYLAIEDWNLKAENITNATWSEFVESEKMFYFIEAVIPFTKGN